jgi:hypothetical protein
MGERAKIVKLKNKIGVRTIGAKIGVRPIEIVLC